MKTRKAASFAVLWTLQLLSLVSQVLTSGKFELDLGVFRNDRGLNSVGNCCNGYRKDGMCSATCKTFFRICLAHYQANIASDSKCTFGSVESPVLGDNTVDFSRSDIKAKFENPITFHIEFSWPGSFSLIVEAWHDATLTNPTTGSPRELIGKILIQSSSPVGKEWRQTNQTTRYTHLALKYRYVCDDNYYGNTCSILCRKRDDEFGHYTCDPNGQKVCFDGWTGNYCDQAICKEGCSKKNGYCDKPNECKCRMGYQGTNCTDCIPFPGCQHGYCTERFQCNCEEGWGGVFCNQDLNYCTHHKPCKNQGTCMNTGQGSYTCMCPSGYNGTTCEIEIDDCERQPCKNGATCKDYLTGFTCSCPQGFYGRLCEFTSNSCETNPCENGGTCIENEDTYKCTCQPGYEGFNCENEINECKSNPCKNEGSKCIDMLNGFRCNCATGYRGPTCEEDEDNCAINSCQNNGTCIDKLNSFTCWCKPGFVGELCEINVDDCRAGPCANGGSCTDLVNDYLCTCAVGFTGKTCSKNINDCDPNPCRNGAKCVDHVGDYTCECPKGFLGKNCQYREGDDQTWIPPQTTQPVTAETTEIQEPEITTPSNHTIMNTPSGQRQEQSLTTAQLLIIICVGSGVPLLLIIVLVTVCLCRKRHHRMHENMEIERRQNIKNNISSVKCVESNIFTTIPQSTSNSSSIKNSNEEQDLNRKNSKYSIEKSNSRQFTKDLNTHDQLHSPTYLPKDIDFDKSSRRLDLETASPVDSSPISDYSPRDLEENIAKPSYSETNRNSYLVLDHPHRMSHCEEVLATEV